MRYLSVPLLIISLFFIGAHLAYAEGFRAASDECIIIIASRKSAAETNEFLSDLSNNFTPQVYLTDTNWLAITAGAVKKHTAQAKITRWKNAGQIPMDSFCSSGRSLIEKVRLNDGTIDKEWINTYLFAGVDFSIFSKNDLRALQAALTLHGEYEGLIDGEWGPRSQSAFVSYVNNNYTTTPSRFHIAMLAAELVDEIEKANWTLQTFPESNLSLLLPKGIVSPEREPDFYAWSNPDETLSIIVSHGHPRLTASIHKEILKDAPTTRRPIYKVRNEYRWVTAITYDDGGRVYLRSDRNAKNWSNVFLFATAEHRHDLALMAASVSNTDISNIYFNDEGFLWQQIEFAIYGSGESKPEQSAKVAVTDESPRSSGTGFYINEAGQLLTNEHVVENCSAISVNAYSYEITALSPEFDLAVISPKLSAADPTKIARFSRNEAKLNSDVTVAGFPYLDLFQDISITRGAVSSLSGILGDPSQIRITAPVQSGNSGGPLLDKAGNVVGVIVSKLNAQKVAENFGDTPQNVNFAINADVAKFFLRSNQIQFHEANSAEALTSTEIAELASEFTHPILCY
ncbi:S1 family peptidase [Maritalea mediterranea]|uniref:Serine protease n=1 Tax=Maritalea mediterranea TaxID=2909667 RepID=A0ABS9ED05_9HYPH|nr:serine protease [Maritalea mediterranea]MCF4099779.1 serine protease [Maritalea mediterranea]